MPARIYRPSKNAMQSGVAGTREWVLEFEPRRPRQVEPLMGWTSSFDTRRQVRLRFDSRAEAEAYAQRKGIAYTVQAPKDRVLRPMSYADNFRPDRRESWTH